MRKNERSEERQLVTDSWNRCQAWGLSHDDKPAARTADPAYLKQVELKHHELMASTAAEVVPYYRNVLSSSRCLILMADPDGTILKSWGDERVTDAASGHGSSAAPTGRNPCVAPTPLAPRLPTNYQCKSSAMNIFSNSSAA